MSAGPSSFEERPARPRIRRHEAISLPEPSGGAAPPASAAAGPAPSTQADRARLAKDLRQDVKATIDEWLTERSNTVSLAVAQIVEDALTGLQQAHAARLGEMQTAHEVRIAALEQEHADVLRAARRRRRASVRATERELREKIERLERSLTAASLESVERMRDVERREADRRRELEQAQAATLRDKDEELERLKRGASGDPYHDSLHDQLLARRRDRTGEQH